MTREPLRSFAASFASLPDPRMDRTRKHNLLDIMTISMFAVLCGADSFTEIEAYGQSKEQWLRGFLVLPNGIPSHDTFGRVFSLLDPQRFGACLLDWVQQSIGLVTAQQIAFDGKTLRRSHDRGNGKAALHLISAWATESGISLGQLKVAGHENEIVALPALIEQVVMPGAVVTIDAMGCQREIARTIVDRGGEYVLALKANQRELHESVMVLFDDGLRRGFTGDTMTYDCDVDGVHGRVERRECWAVADPAVIDYLDPQNRWPGLQSVVMVKTQRTTGDSVQSETRYYLSSLPADAKRHNTVVRTHWRIENQLHWVLDVVFNEDQSRIRTGYADQNFAALRRWAISLLTNDKSQRAGKNAKRLRAGWDNAYLLRLLTQ